MPSISEEKKLSQAMQKCMDRLSFDPALVILDFGMRNSNMQNRMMDLIMGFLHQWAHEYKEGLTRPGEIMHRLGEMSDTMLGSLTAEANGAHHPKINRRRREIPLP